MPLHCGIFYVAGIVPRAAGSPPALIQANSREGPDLCRPRRRPGAALTLPPFPLYGLAFCLLYSCHSCQVCILRPAALLPFQPAATSGFADSASPASEPLRAARYTHLRFVRLFSGYPTSAAGRHNGFCDKPCIAYRNQPLSFCFYAFIIAQACPNHKDYS